MAENAVCVCGRFTKSFMLSLGSRFSHGKLRGKMVKSNNHFPNQNAAGANMFFFSSDAAHMISWNTCLIGFHTCQRLLFFNETTVQHKSADRSLSAWTQKFWIPAIPATYTTTGDFYQGNPRSKSTFLWQIFSDGPRAKHPRFRFDAWAGKSCSERLGHQHAGFSLCSLFIVPSA